MAYGAIRNGGLAKTIVNVWPDVPKLYSGKVYNLKLQVSADKKFQLFLDGKQLGGKYDTIFRTLGRGGVAIANGYSNIANFKNFQLTPTDV